MIGCSPKVELPEAARGEWQQPDYPSFLLKLEQKGENAEVSFWIFDKWSNPFKIKQEGPNKWSFKNDSYAVSRDLKYGKTSAALFLLEQTELSRGRTVQLVLENGQLTAQGLWLNIKNEDWDLAAKKPKKQNKTPIFTRFIKANPFPDMPAEVLVKGALLGSSGLPITDVQIFVVPFGESEWTESSDDPSSKTDIAGRFAISVTRSFFEKTWRKGFKEYVLAYAEEGAARRLVPAYRSETVPFKLERGEKEFVLGDVSDDEEPSTAVGYTTPASLLKRVDPIYPKAAQEAGVEGSVILQATISTEGKVESVKILSSIPLLDQAAIEAVRQWIYKPMEVNKKPKETILTVTVRFALK